jgi:hypothetical protein
MAYDSAHGMTVLFGGYYNEGAGDVRLADTWEWDGTTWMERTPTSHPTARHSPVMAYDSARHRVVLFGGYDGVWDHETWEWDGATWTQRATAGPTLLYTALAYDSSRGRCVLFGGRHNETSDCSDTWEWDGNEWTHRATDGPDAREGHALAYDYARGRVMAFGGYSMAQGTCLGDTWDWDGSAWSEATTTGPSNRSNVALAAASVWNKVLLFGGWDGAANCADTWEWNGTVWTQHQPVDYPSARRGHAMVYDSARRRVVLFGGHDGTYVGDTWVYRGLLPGDLNCDGVVTFGDINPFVLYLSNFTAWQAAYPGCTPQVGDINGDGNYPSFRDINPFVSLLSSGQGPCE